MPEGNITAPLNTSDSNHTFRDTMAKKISQLPVKTSLASNDIFVFVDDAFTDDNETSYVTFDTLKTQLGLTMGTSETTSATYHSSNDTIEFLRSNGTKYYATLDHDCFQFDSVRITGANAPGNGFSLRWNNASIQASEALTTNPVQIRTATAHPFANGDLVNFTNFTNMFELNNSDFYIKTVNTTAFDLYQDAGLSITLNGTSFSGNATTGSMKLSGVDGYWSAQAADLVGLSDVNIDSSRATGDILRWDGTYWNNANTDQILSSASLTDVGNVRTDNLSKGQALRYNNQQYTITNIEKQSPARITTLEDHNIKAYDQLQISGVVGMTQMNGITVYAGVPNYTNRTIQLYVNADLSTPLDSSLYSNYVSGGVINGGTGMWTNKGFYESGEVIQTRAHILQGMIIVAKTTPTPGGAEFQVDFTPKSSTSTVIFEYNFPFHLLTNSNARVSAHHVGFWLYDHTNGAIVDANGYSSKDSNAFTNGDFPHCNLQLSSQFGIDTHLMMVFSNTSKATRTFGIAVNNSGGFQSGNVTSTRQYILGSVAGKHPNYRVNSSNPTLKITEIAN